MRYRAPSFALLCTLLAACAGGSGGAPTLGYAVPASPSLTYAVGDTLTIAVQGLGQPLELAVRSAARYGVTYAAASQGLAATAAIESLSAELAVPMGEPMTMDESVLEGDFAFELDTRGRVLSMSSPSATDVGGQVFGAAAPLLAYSLFPRLPGRVVAVGDSWADSLTYTQTLEAGETEVTSALTYTVLGETQMAGRSLLDIGFEGTAEISQEMSIEGAAVNLAAETEVSGSLLWDRAAGVLYESDLTMEGPGQARMAMLPAALPTRMTWRTTVRLQDR